MDAHTVSVVQTTLSSSKSLSLASSSPNRFALLAAFTTWATMWRVIAEQHANELQKTVEAAAAWRSQLRGRFDKTVPSNVVSTAQADVMEDSKDSKDSKSQVGSALEEGHDVELQRALEAAAAWRLRLQKSRPHSKVTTVPKSNIRGVDGSAHKLAYCVVEDSVNSPVSFVSKGQDEGSTGDLRENVSNPQVVAPSDAAHYAELQEALIAASKWRSRFQSKEHIPQNRVNESIRPCGSSHESNGSCNLKTKQGLLAILQEDLDSGSTTAASGDEGSCGSSDSDASPTCWVYGAYLRDVSKISAHGVRLQGRRVHLYSGPWGRKGLCRRNEEVLIYIDVLGARAAGTEFRYSQRGLVLVDGMIPASCCRKMVMIKDGSVLYDRTSEPQEA